MKQKYDPFKHITTTGSMYIGIMGTNTIINKMPNNPNKTNIQSSMNTMNLIPTTYAIGGIFQGLKDLEKKAKK